MKNETALNKRLSGLPQILWLIAALLAFTILFTIVIHAALGGNQIGADFYIFWRAGRALFIEQQNPYTEEVMQETQLAILGRMAGPAEDNLAFAYPLYSLYGILPAILLPFDWAISFWYAFSLTALLTLLFFVFPGSSKAVSLTTLLFYPVLFGLVMGNFSIPVGLAILFFYGLLVLRGMNSPAMQALAGILLAWATLKPQFVWLSLFFALLYALRLRWYPFLAAFAATFVVLFVSAFWLLPGWPADWLRFVCAYASYQQIAPSLVEILRAVLPGQWADITGWVLLALLTGALAFFTTRWWQGKTPWLNILALAGLITYLIHPHGLSYEQIPALIPLLLWFVQKDAFRSGEGAFFWISAMVVSWLPLFNPGQSIAIDRSPILWTAVWVAWLYLKKKEQSPQAATAFTV